ncbi:hypothetical protein Emin_0242 [Elusimicrobium minutum Pei191]|uniref:Uncharacterized protein n=1 Tax=Elusimicrobium minutum (strain Pei191) TaxID=445932 RepID=B2KB45_ELUMP|nr:hypothetical protein [Elusimicrobium minutum]ACC97804.1 hypothetical protein Emin_0242 [Elusimicrobium minutum Pei191]
MKNFHHVFIFPQMICHDLFFVSSYYIPFIKIVKRQALQEEFDDEITNSKIAPPTKTEPN